MDVRETLTVMARADFVERSPLTRAALAFADVRHEGQTRDLDDVPFVTHPVEVACLLHDAGYSDEVVAAGVLHDVLEDTDTDSRDLEASLEMLSELLPDDPLVALLREELDAVLAGRQ